MCRIAEAVTPDRTLYGVALMLAFCVLAPVLDTCAKLATATIPVGQITTARFVVQSALMAPIAGLMGLDWRVSARDLRLLTLRAVLLIISTLTFVAATAVMPIADALAIVFIEPFILLLLGHLIFGNPIGPRRIAASIVGFVGVLLVIQPSIASYGTVALLPMGTALFFALYMLITQAIGETLHPVVQQLHTSLIGAAICVPVMIWANGLGLPGLDPVMPQDWAWVWLFGVGFWAAASHMCMTVALKFAPASTMAPLHYLEIVTAVVLGLLVFGDFPNALTWAGIVVIIAAGLYIIHRERSAATPSLPRPPQGRPAAK